METIKSDCSCGPKCECTEEVNCGCTCWKEEN